MRYYLSIRGSRGPYEGEAVDERFTQNRVLTFLSRVTIATELLGILLDIANYACR
jgi:hypothetical protein